MDWNGSLRPFVSRPPDSSFNFLYNFNFEQFPDMKIGVVGPDGAESSISGMTERGNYMGNQEKKKRMNSDQIEGLERSFQEEIKLDPDRKMKLSKELGLQPRQIAVWFQNRRARWKAKQLERLYDALKYEYDLVSREKHKLQEEVSKLKSILREQAVRKQVSTLYTDISGEETEESMSVAIGSGNGQIAGCNYVCNVEDYSPVSPPFWGGLPSYHNS